MPDKPTIRLYQYPGVLWRVNLNLPQALRTLEIITLKSKADAMDTAKQLAALFIDPPEIEVLD